MTEFIPPKITIGMPCGGGNVPWATMMSLLNTVRACDKEGIPIRIESIVGCPIVQWARSIIVEKFLKSDATHLFWIDADIVWTVDDFFRIVGFGGVLDVVGATYPFKREDRAFIINTAGEPGELEVNGLGCVKIKSIGLGFTIMKRAVVEKVAATKERVLEPSNGIEFADVFRVDRTENGPRGEDVAFFDDVREAGYDVWLDPSVNLGHIGTQVYRGNVIDALGLQDYAKVTQKKAETA
jgi:hypothetical protein